ncbi:MAG: endonuclease/exonuclease/phosphatase family protein [Planctomycetota bacterium]
MAKKDMKANKPKTPKARKNSNPGVVSANDKISRYLQAKKVVPARLAGTDKFLDIVSWNIRWFDHKDPKRVKLITDVLDALNADVFILNEISGKGVLDGVIDRLADRGAGYYSVVQGETGAEQRVSMLWDRDWVRAKVDTAELFGGEKLTVPAEFGTKPQSVFPRLPLWGYFEAKAANPGDEGFTFELVGVHLKAQGPAPKGYTGPKKDRWGIPQRTKAAERLSRWLTSAQDHNDTDIIVMGDWNAVPGEEEWRAIRDLEAQGEVAFQGINDESEISHMVRLNKFGPAGSRLDLHLVTDEAQANSVPDNAAVVIKWTILEKDKLSGMDVAGRNALSKTVRDQLSDHLPVVSRFYLHEV